MAATITIEAPTIEEAVQKALEKLGASRNEVRVRVLQQPRSLLFGLRRRPARVEVSKRDLASMVVDLLGEQGTCSPVAGDQELVDGSVCIEDGQVIVTPPVGNGRYPAVEAGAHVEIRVNGHKIRGRRVIFPGDDIEVVPLHEPPERTLAVQLSSDRMKAILRVRMKCGGRYTVDDSKPATLLKASASLQSPLRPEPLSEEEVRGLLRQKGVVFGIDDSALAQVVEQANRSDEFDEEIVVARGKKGRPPVDAEVRYNFPLRPERVVDLQADVLDYRDAIVIPSVEAGAIIAYKTEPKAGTPAVDVTGREIRPRPPREPVLRAGQGAEIAADGRQVVATRSGRPVVSGSLVRVLSAYVVEGDADLSTGNIRFDGDVHIHGNVCEGVEIQASGIVAVVGGVEKATLTAEQGIHVGGSVIASHLVAGGKEAVFGQLAMYLRNLSYEINALVQATEVIKQHMVRRGLKDRLREDGDLVQLLVELKFQDIPKTIDRMGELVRTVSEECDLHDCVADAFARLSGLLKGRGPSELKELGELAELSRFVRDVAKSLEEHLAEPADVAARYALNAYIECTGKIIISGKACYNSTLIAGSGVEVRYGTVRGGEITVQKGDVLAKELGSPGEVKTKISIVESGVVKARVAMPGVTVRMRGQRREVVQALQGFVAALDPEGTLQLSGREL